MEGYGDGEGKTEMVGDHTGDGMYKWSGGVYADGFIYGIPCNARRMFMIDGGGTHEVDIGRTERGGWLCNVQCTADVNDRWGMDT